MTKELRETLYGFLERSPPSRPPWTGRFGIFDAGPALVLLQLAGTLARHTGYLLLCGTSKTLLGRSREFCQYEVSSVCTSTPLPGWHRCIRYT
ncbi:hypothetical protein JMJ77_0007650 [Colletotrichum scovillei]|uniref:Uncharacterized protein n=1 Tax=Colletotrichum scovillei TaxID=1209932 RepID=A0A9P7RFF6_9PEZI|nr:hypothetical protein JMJ77_0007650 [Colletotrichum scovillei]KAG7074600.1 hypothetical protein JMJ76_0011076 [Colletotrichum scovillei]KAG7081722.1 hypothetical protein JMJ78_0003837 [Colletotrichum scovillei]